MGESKPGIANGIPNHILNISIIIVMLVESLKNARLKYAGGYIAVFGILVLAYIGYRWARIDRYDHYGPFDVGSYFTPILIGGIALACGFLLYIFVDE